MARVMEVSIDMGQLERPASPRQKIMDGSVAVKSWVRTSVSETDWFSVYRRLHLASLAFNIIGLALSISGHFPYAKARAPLFALGNIFAVVLARNEAFLRFVFWLVVRLFGHWWVPLRVKTMVTSLLLSVGGIHSGCGLGATMWLVYAIVLNFQHRHMTSNAILGLAFGILSLLVLSSLAAIPTFRRMHHNVFERVHRFAGWTAVGLVWAYILLSTLWNPATQSYSNSSKELLQSESLWFIVVITFMIILPWLSVRRVAVETVVASSKLNSLLTFEGGVKPGLFKRISPSLFSEWHAFGVISDGQNWHTLVCGALGDFTKSLTTNPPTHMWTRTMHFAGVPYLVNMYRRVLLVATGGAIGVYLSFLLQETKADLHMIWITKKIPETFGDWMWEAVKDIPPEKLTIIDTALSGRPRTVELAVTKAKDWRADMVAVTSNPKGTYDVVKGCRAVGIPAFGPIWDS